MSGAVQRTGSAKNPRDDAAPIQLAVDVSNLSKRYGRTVALDGLNLAIESNSVFGLLGPNGAGKTTLIHILGTILRPDSGVVKICGIDIRRQPRQARKRLGVIFQEPSLDGRLTVFENLEFHGLVYGVSKTVRRRRIPELMEIVGLAEWRDSLVQTLSAGMKRRVEIARALVHDASVIILDEPTVGLDAQSRENMWSYLKQLRQQRQFTLIVTTHYIEEVDEADKVCIIDHGKVLALDSPDALRAKHGKELVKVTPRDAAATAILLKKFPGATADEQGLVSIAGAEGGSLMESLIGDHGSHIRSISYDRPTLESVFLNLTGRAIRDGSNNGTAVQK